MLGDGELNWAQPKRRLYQALTIHGTYFIVADTGNWRYMSRLWYVAKPYSPDWDLFSKKKQQHLAYGRIRFLMHIAEIDAVQRVTD